MVYAPDPTAAIILYAFMFVSFALGIAANLLLNHFLIKRGWLTFLITIPVAFVWYFPVVWITTYMLVPMLPKGVVGGAETLAGTTILMVWADVFFVMAGSAVASIGRFVWNLLKKK